MRGDLPIPGSTRARLLDAGMELFSTQEYAAVEVTPLAARAGVTIGALYHHFQSKQGIYGVLRDEVTRRLLDRIEAAAGAAPAERRLLAAILAAYDGVYRIGAGRLLTDPDPRGIPDALAEALAETARTANTAHPEITGQLLVAALQAALRAGNTSAEAQEYARTALENLLL